MSMDEFSSRLVAFWGKVAQLGARHAATIHCDAVMAEVLRFAAGPELLISAGCSGIQVEEGQVYEATAAVVFVCCVDSANDKESTLARLREQLKRLTASEHCAIVLASSYANGQVYELKSILQEEADIWRATNCELSKDATITPTKILCEASVPLYCSVSPSLLTCPSLARNLNDWDVIHRAITELLECEAATLHMYTAGGSELDKLATRICQQYDREGSHSLGLVLLDRRLDLAQCLAQQPTAGDVVYQRLSSPASLSSDRHANLAALLDVEPLSLYASLAQPGSNTFTRTCTDVMTQQSLKKAARRLKELSNDETAATAAEAFVKALKGKDVDTDQTAMLQLLAIVEEASSRDSTTLDNLQALERTLLSPAASDPDILSQLIETVAVTEQDTADPSKQPPDVIVRLTAALFSFMNATRLSAEPAEVIDQLAQVLAHAAHRCFGMDVESTTRKLAKSIKQMRGKLLDIKNAHPLLANCSNRNGMYSPALPQALNLLLNPDSDMSAFNCVSSKSDNVMQSAMGLFGSVMGVSSTKHPATCDRLVIFVTGTVMWSEIAALEDAIRRRNPDCQVTIMSPSLSNGSLALKTMLPNQLFAA
eukprot:TRINITY_DN5297_c0_g1_i1.p1 TRINITY_DN5297_c0_g1~~TRINITY_DN5297_c0_g1_i1.p1  ORF type:complete len:597 (+),score=134.86 TRINITY_DN5297_c0_g1_i1:62-1852(+)